MFWESAVEPAVEAAPPALVPLESAVEVLSETDRALLSAVEAAVPALDAVD